MSYSEHQLKSSKSIVTSLPLSVLCVDDELAILENLTELLCDSIHHLYTAKNAHDAIDIINNHHPDVVITDIYMPQMNGFELAKKIQKEFPLTEIMFLTAHVDVSNMGEAIKLGISNYIHKPIVDIQSILEPLEKIATQRGRKLFKTINTDRFRNTLDQTSTDEIYEKILKRLQTHQNNLQEQEFDMAVYELAAYEAELKAQNQEIKETSKLLLDEYQKTEAFFYDAPVPYILIDNNFSIIRANFLADDYFKFHQYRSSEARKFSFFIVAEHLEKFYKWISSEEAYQYPIQLKLKSAFAKETNYFKIIARTHPINNSYKMLTLINIQEEKNLYDKLNSSEKETLKRKNTYKNILKYATDRIFIMDIKNGDLIEYSSETQKLLGFNSEEMKNLNVKDWDKSIKNEEDYQRIIKNVAYEPICFEQEHTRKDGSTYLASIRAVKFQCDSDEFLYASVRDITEQRANELRWKYAIEGNGDGLWDWNLQTNEVFFSKQWKLMLGFQEDEIDSTLEEWEKRVHPEDLKDVYNDIEEHLSGKTDSYFNEHRVLCKNGNYKWILDRGVVLQRDTNGKALRMIGTHTDIDYEKNLQNSLIEAKQIAEEASKSKSSFLANMSHEIRTPMTGLLGFVERLSKDEKDPQRLKQFSIIKSSGESLLQIINDILDFSKIESGKLDIEHTPYLAQNLFFKTPDIFQSLASSKNINMIATGIENIPNSIYGDPVRIKQVLFNLISNAIKFTNNGGTITLQTRYIQERKVLCIAVLDTGIGIAQDKLDTIFEAFSQEDTSTTRRFGGTGLGLSISSRLIALMGGELKVESEIGKGSKFFFEIPVEICSKEQLDQIAQNQSDEEEHHFDADVLVVEDNKTNQMLMGMILQDLGVRYDIANDGAEGVLKAKHKNYDLILMDENMPHMNGIEATKIIREYEDEGQHIPIIAVTANALVKDRERFLAIGMDDYVSKPYTEDDIVRIFTKYL